MEVSVWEGEHICEYISTLFWETEPTFKLNIDEKFIELCLQI